MRRSHADLTTAGLVSQHRQHQNLVALDAPDFDDVGFDADELEGVETVEDGTSIRSVVLFDVDARRIRFGEVRPVEAHTAQRLRNELEMINFLNKTKK